MQRGNRERLMRGSERNEERHRKEKKKAPTRRRKKWESKRERERGPRENFSRRSRLSFVAKQVLSRLEYTHWQSFVTVSQKLLLYLFDQSLVLVPPHTSERARARRSFEFQLETAASLSASPRQTPNELYSLRGGTYTMSYVATGESIL